MNSIKLLILAYIYSHYGTMILLYFMNFYDKKKKEMYLDLIPLRWVYTTYKDFFKNKSE